MRYGEVLRQARRKANLSQEKLAERIGVVRTTISAWESEKFPPTDVQKISALEKGLDMPLGSLYNLLTSQNPIRIRDRLSA